MGRGAGRDTWAHQWFDANDQCRYVAESGLRCSAQRNRRFANLRADHLLRQHNVNEKTVLPTAAGLRSIREAFASMCPVLSSAEELHCLLARHGLPNRLVNDPLFRKLTNTSISRNNVPSAMASLSEKLLSAALKHMRSSTLAIDIGTVHSRYLAFVVISRGRALFFKMVDDKDERVNGHFTTAAMRTVVKDVIAELKARGVEVNAIVADNASNMQGLGNTETETEELRSRLPCVIRCACHVLQLAVKDIQPVWESAWKISEQLIDQHKIKLSSNDTRWNSKFRMIERALAIEGISPNHLRELSDAFTVLHPFAVATDYLQRDDARMLDAVCVIESLMEHFTKISRGCTESATGRAMKEVLQTTLRAVTARANMLFNKAYLVLAFFAPSTDHEGNAAHSARPVVRQFMNELYEVSDEEWQRFENFVLDASPNAVTYSSYRRHIAAIIRPLCPTIACVVLGLLEASPSEASVERLFSNLKFSFDQWRNRASATLVNACLQVASGYSFFNPAWAVDDDEAEERMTRSVSKTHRAETPASPDPRQPEEGGEGADEPEEVVDADEEEDLGTFKIHTSTNHVLQQILENNETIAAPTVVDEHTRRTTRTQMDRCQACGKACSKHKYLGYIMCGKCSARKSVEHYVRFQTEKTKSEHAPVEATWICPDCLQKCVSS